MTTLVPNDKNSPVRFVSPLGDDLLVFSMHGKEEMGRLSVFDMELVSPKSDLNFDNVVGQQVTATLVIQEGERHFNGYITEFKYLGWDGVYSRYAATIRPWLWLLTRTSDCRVFQKMTVPDIIKKIFKLNNMVDFKVNLTATYREWEYCVQYNESDFNFVSRLMEQEGIYYFFEHKADKHVMVIVDDASGHVAYPGFAEVPYNPKTEKLSLTLDSLDAWVATQSIMPARYAAKVYDFKNPKADLLAKYNPNTKGHVWPIDDPEVFDYPGHYVTRDDGKNYVEIRLQELQCQKERVQAKGGCRGLSPGYTFKLKDYPRDDQNKEYLTISIEHEINNGGFFAAHGISDQIYRCNVELMDEKKLPFRTARKARKPMVQGPQTAIVVGPSSEEIHTDEYGRVIVQFHWDRYGTSDENSSCWVRVSQLWAGTRWGGIHIPRIGQEVVVSFLEGDPDRPLITGSVYNANCMPPYSLAANKTQSGIKSRSSMGGGPDNFNEIRMEDKKDEELLYIQAERDEKIYVKKDKTEIVGENEKIDIYGSRDETVHEDETINVKKNREELVEENETLEVQKDRVRKVGANETIAVGKTRSHTVEVDEKIKIGKNQDISVGKQQSIEVSADRKLVIKGNHTIDAKKDETHDVGKKLVISAGTSITLKCGSASISMKKNGDIKIDGKNVILNGSGKIVAKAGGDIVLKGSKVLEN